MSWNGVVPPSCACPQFRRLRRGSGFWQFVAHLLRMEQKRQDDLACDEEPWCLSGSDSSDGRSEVGDESEVSDFSPIMATIDQGFLVVRTCWLLVKETKVTGVLYMRCFPCLSYVDSACTSFGTIFVCMFGLGCLMSKTQSNDGLSAWYSHERGHYPWALHAWERGRERELSSEKKTANSTTRKDFSETWKCSQKNPWEWECSQLTASLRFSSRTCMHAESRRGARSTLATCSWAVTCRSIGDRATAPLTKSYFIHPWSFLARAVAGTVAIFQRQFSLSVETNGLLFF